MTTSSTSAAVRAANAGLLSTLPFEDTSDFVDARRGFIGRLDPCIVKAAVPRRAATRSGPRRPVGRDPGDPLQTVAGSATRAEARRSVSSAPWTRLATMSAAVSMDRMAPAP